MREQSDFEVCYFAIGSRPTLLYCSVCLVSPLVGSLSESWACDAGQCPVFIGTGACSGRVCCLCREFAPIGSSGSREPQVDPDDAQLPTRREGMEDIRAPMSRYVQWLWVIHTLCKALQVLLSDEPSKRAEFNTSMHKPNGLQLPLCHLDGICCSCEHAYNKCDIHGVAWLTGYTRHSMVLSQ